MTVAELLEGRVRDAIVAAFGAEHRNANPAVHRSSFADFQADAALRLAKPLGKKPLEIAEAIRAKLDVKGLADEGGVTVSPPGFVNFVLSQAFLEARIQRMAEDERSGVARVATPETVVIDYSGPNVAKEMHVGHLRSTVIGDALARTLEFLGHRVIRQNHVGDWGTPFGMLIEHLCDVGAESAASELSQGSLTEFYQAARRKFDADPAFADRARQRVVLLQKGDEATLAHWKTLVGASRRYFSRVYERLGVLLDDGDVKGESAYNDLLPDMAGELEARGIARRDAGALCVFLEGYRGKDGALVPLIVQKSDGGFGYAATDIAGVRYRTQTLGATRVLYVIGAPQKQHLDMVFETCKKAGWLGGPARAEHVAFGSVLGSDKKMLKTRAGGSVRLADLLDEAVERATKAVREKNPGLSDAEIEGVAEAVGIGAVKYVDLSSDRIKDYVFDWDRMLAFEGNTGPYLQYAHARICSIARKAAGDGLAPSADGIRLADSAERRLAVELLELETAVAQVARGLEPHKLCGFLYDLATAFTTFYESCPVLKAGAPELVASRLALCEVTRRTLSLGLGLLGIRAPERM